MIEEPLYLIHSSKGKTWKSHKYLQKINNRYFYTQAALNAYLKKKGSKNKVFTEKQETDYDKGYELHIGEGKDRYTDQIYGVYKNKNKDQIEVWNGHTDKWFDKYLDEDGYLPDDYYKDVKIGPVTYARYEDGEHWFIDVGAGTMKVAELLKKNK